MISGALLWSALPRMWKWGIGVFVLIALLGAFLVIRHQIYSEGFRAAQEVCERVRKEMEEANNRAVRAAEQMLMRQADELSLKSKELDDALKAIDEASAADPDGASCGLSDRSVQRLQAIGAGPNPSP